MSSTAPAPHTSAAMQLHQAEKGTSLQPGKRPLEQPLGPLRLSAAPATANTNAQPHPAKEAAVFASPPRRRAAPLLWPQKHGKNSRMHQTAAEKQLVETTNRAEAPGEPGSRTAIETATHRWQTQRQLQQRGWRAMPSEGMVQRGGVLLSATHC